MGQLRVAGGRRLRKMDGCRGCGVSERDSERLQPSLRMLSTHQRRHVPSDDSHHCSICLRLQTPAADALQQSSGWRVVWDGPGGNAAAVHDKLVLKLKYMEFHRSVYSNCGRC